jgi:hypothetical protein
MGDNLNRRDRRHLLEEYRHEAPRRIRADGRQQATAVD